MTPREPRIEHLIGAIAEGIWQGHRRNVKHYRNDWAPYVLEALTSAGYRIIGPGELDAETVEKCAALANGWGRRNEIGQQIATAIRALAKEKKG